MESRARRRVTALAAAVVAAVLSDSAAGRGRAVAARVGMNLADALDKCPMLATARADEQTKLGFSPNDALRALRVVPRTLIFSRETSASPSASLFAELGLSPVTRNDEAVLDFAASGAPSTYCPARPDWPLWIPGTLTVHLSRGPILTDKTSLGVRSSGGRPTDGTVDGAAFVGQVEVRIAGQINADRSLLSLWTGNGSDTHWYDVHGANDTAAAPPGLPSALHALGGRPMSCGGRSPAIDVTVPGFGEIELRVAWPDAPPLTFRLPIRFAFEGHAVRGWRLTGPSSQAAAPPPSIARQAGCARPEDRPWWGEFEVTPDSPGHLHASGTLSWPGGCAARVTCAF